MVFSCICVCVGCPGFRGRFRFRVRHSAVRKLQSEVAQDGEENAGGGQTNRDSTPPLFSWHFSSERGRPLLLRKRLLQNGKAIEESLGSDDEISVEMTILTQMSCGEIAGFTASNWVPMQPHVSQIYADGYA